MIYFDNAATSLIKPEAVYRASLKAMKTMASPGRGSYKAAMRAAKELFECRMAAAELFNAEGPENIVFTMNATHGLNIAIKSMVKEGTRVLVSGFEHNSVMRPLYAQKAEIKIAGRELFNREKVLEDFKWNVDKAQLVVCTHVSNAFGFILPIYEIAELCLDRGVPLIVDASQSAGILPVDMQKLGAAFIAMPGHKGLMGPQGTGILICGRDAMPLMEGGSGSDSASKYMPDYLPDRLEAGTHNVCGIAGLRAGINFVKQKGIKNIYNHEKKLLNEFVYELNGSGYELFKGKEDGQLGLLSLRHPKLCPEAVAERLAKAGICVRSGLHCAALAHESAGTLKSGTVRFSFSAFNDFRQINYCTRQLLEIV